MVSAGMIKCKMYAIDDYEFSSIKLSCTAKKRLVGTYS